MPTANITLAAQGSGSGAVLQKPSVEVSFTFSVTGTGNVSAAQISLDGGSTWTAAVLASGYTGTGLTSSGTSKIIVDLGLSSVPAVNINNAKVKFTLTDSGGSTTVTSSAFSLKTTSPTVSATSSPYFGVPGWDQQSVAIGTLTFSLPGAYQYQASESSGSLDSAPIQTVSSGNGSYSVDTTVVEGPKTIYVQIYDTFYNKSAVTTVGTTDSTVPLPVFKKFPPANVFASITGTVGNGIYTGIRVNDDGSLTPDRRVTVFVFASTSIPIPLQFKIETTSDVESGSNNTDSVLAGQVGVFQDFDAQLTSKSSQVVKLRKTTANPAADDFNVDANCTVRVTFQDAAGNYASASPVTIRLNTRIYQSAHHPLLPGSVPAIREVVTQIVNGRPVTTEVALPQVTPGTTPIRPWRDIFYPPTHSFPLTVTGDIDQDAALAMAGVSTPDNDAVDRVYLGNNVYTLAVDSDGRPIMTSGWTADGTKIYEDFLSSSVDNLTSWVLDTGDTSDVVIDFEDFAVDPTIAPPPLNPLAPYPQDVLVIYDATAPGATERYIDEFGKPALRIRDSSLLTELMALTGSGINVIDLTSGKSVNASSNGKFTVGPFLGVSRVAIVLYSHLRPFRADQDKKRAAGFRIMSGRKQIPNWSNWEVDLSTGQVWVHKANGQVPGAADSTDKKFIYQYYSEQVDVDPETGTVTFGVAPTGTVTMDYSYYNAPSTTTLTYLLSQDDVYELVPSTVYVARPNVGVLTPTDKSKIYEDDQGGGLHYGRVVTQVTWDKDRGVVTFNAGSGPADFQRVFADYQYHTFKRLTADNLGDLTFDSGNGSTIVPALVSEYPDYTWADIKVTNEGTATLNNGSVTFTFRGYDSNNNAKPDFLTTSNPKDQVLDHNRPWDVQKGTNEETINRLAVRFTGTWFWTSLFYRDQSDVPSSGRPPGFDVNWQCANKYYSYRSSDLRDQYANTAAAMKPGDVLYGRVLWHLGGGGTSYPSSSSLSAGEKRCSIEVNGTYFDSIVFQG